MVGDLGAEVFEVVDGAFAVGCGDDVCAVEAEVVGDFAPGGFDGGDGVGEGAVLSEW